MRTWGSHRNGNGICVQCTAFRRSDERGEAGKRERPAVFRGPFVTRHSEGQSDFLPLSGLAASGFEGLAFCDMMSSTDFSAEVEVPEAGSIADGISFSFS